MHRFSTNLFRYFIAIILGFSVALASSTKIFATAFVDPELQAWADSKDDAKDALLPIRQVLIYFRTASFVDRSGLPQTLAQMEEQSFEHSYLRGKIKEIADRIFGEVQDNDFLWSSSAVIVHLDKSALRFLKHLSDIEGIVADETLKIDDPIAEQPPVHTDQSKLTYGLQLLNVKSAWDQGIYGDGVTVGVIDTGVDEKHPDLAGKILKIKDFTSDGNTEDGVGHGTHVCGTIVGGNSSGTSIGVAPHAKIVMAKVFDHNGETSTSVLLKAMEWMLHPSEDPSADIQAPRVVSNSWGSGIQFYYGFRNVIRSWRRFEIFPNFAAGNSGSWYFTIGAPASYPFSYAVAAIGEDREITDFSSRGPTVWWKDWHPIFITKPDIAAPGLSVVSSLPGKSWGEMSGTSMATPHMAGVIALALQANPKLQVEDLMEILNSSTLDPEGKGSNNRYGHGIIQVDQVIAKAKSWKIKNTGSSFQDKDPNQWEWDTP